MARQCLHEKSVFIGQFEQKKIAVFTTIFSDFPFRDFWPQFSEFLVPVFPDYKVPVFGVSGPFFGDLESSFCPFSLALRPLPAPFSELQTSRFSGLQGPPFSELLSPSRFRSFCPLTGPSGDYLEGWAAGASAAGVSAGASVVDSAAGISACAIAAGASVSSTRS